MECNDVNQRICNITPSNFYKGYPLNSSLVHISVNPFLVSYALDIDVNEMKAEMKEKKRTEC